MIDFTLFTRTRICVWGGQEGHVALAVAELERARQRNFNGWYRRRRGEHAVDRTLRGAA
jgi:hypothetical protein